MFATIPQKKRGELKCFMQILLSFNYFFGFSAMGWMGWMPPNIHSGLIYFVYSSYECNVGELDKIGPNYVQTCLHSMNLQVQL